MKFFSPHLNDFKEILSTIFAKSRGHLPCHAMPLITSSMDREAPADWLCNGPELCDMGSNLTSSCHY